MPKKIAIVVSTFPPYRGGMGNAAAEQARLLAERGFAVTVFVPQPRGHYEGLPYTVAKLPTLIRWGNAALVTRLKPLREFDLVFLHYPFFGGVERLAFSRLPLVLFYHMDVLGGGVWKVLFALHQSLFLPLLVRRARYVVASTQSYAETSRLGRLKHLVEPKLRIVPFSVDTSRLRPAGSRPAELTVLFVASLDKAHYFKGLSVLMKAWAQVQTMVPSAQCFIVGDGECRAQYEQEARDAGIASTVRFLGNLPAEQLVAHYQLASVLVSPSIDRSEAFGLVILEAMACGTPVVASQLPGVSSLVRHGETGLLVPPGDAKALARALCTVLEDQALRQHFGEAARRVCEQYYEQSVVGDALAEVVNSAL